MEATSGIPITAQKAMVTVQGWKVALTGYTKTIAITSNLLLASLKEYIRTVVHQDVGWAVQNFTATYDGGLIAEALQAGHCVGISDWSFKDEYGTACWVIEGETPQGRIFGPCITLGNAKDQSACRSELAGLYGIVTMLEAICKYHAVTAGKVEIGCDGIQALPISPVPNIRIMT